MSTDPAVLSPNRASNPTYGSQVGPNPPTQDMYRADVLAGTAHDRTASPSEFTGGNGGQGLGGEAIGIEPGVATSGAGTTVERGEPIGL
jgi:hypothetical protein